MEEPGMKKNYRSPVFELDFAIGDVLTLSLEASGQLGDGSVGWSDLEIDE